ncbi:MAG: hypothetical protein RI957_692 [Verrucomicrobiota bacterium]|jgi:alpha-galactosidase
MKAYISRRALLGLSSLVMAALALAPSATAAEINIPRTDGKTADHSKKIKVFILMGQSNMVGMGDIAGGNTAWRPSLKNTVMSVYEGAYAADQDYDKRKALETIEMPLDKDWTLPAPADKSARTCILRGEIQPKEPGVYEFSPGYGASAINIMEVAGKEVYRCEPGQPPVRKAFTFEAGKSYPFKVTYITDQVANPGWMTRTDVPGTLGTLVKQQGKYPYLLDEKGQWSERKDVYFYNALTKKCSPLSALSNNGGNTIGPELGFGLVIGELLDEPVLVLKSCIGNRGLGWDLLPPGSPRFLEDGKIYAGYHEKPPVWDADPAKGIDTPPPPFVDKAGKPIEWHAGLQYDLDLANAKAALAELAKLYPEYKGQGYEIAGFAWWQGHKDQSDVYAKLYEKNLVNLIKALRKDYNAPNAKFVLATGCGNTGRESFGLQIAEAQLAMNDAKKHPEFSGNVKCIDSRDLWREPAVSPRDQGFHYNRNAETYMEVGLRLGHAMADLLMTDK